jgi:hypothetical protein
MQKMRDDQSSGDKAQDRRLQCGVRSAKERRETEAEAEATGPKQKTEQSRKQCLFLVTAEEPTDAREEQGHHVLVAG